MRSAPRELGQASSQYELVARLAEGGMAEIFLARSRGMAGFARYVVLKRILPERGEDPRWIEMFLDEARLVAQLQHPNVAQVFDLGRLGAGYFFTMEYVHGANMREALIRYSQQGQLMPLSMALGVAAGAAAGLDHAHTRRDAAGSPLGIVHRDVSPSNLMVSFDGTVKLVDFGVAKARQRSSATRSGTVKGKISYLSPEQCRGRDVDARSDVFALGIVLYEMCTTKRLYRRGSEFETMTAIVNEIPEPPSRYNREISPGLDELILRALCKEPQGRPQSAAEVLEELEATALRDGLAITPTQLKRHMRELFGEPPEPWRALEVPPAQREAEGTYTADGLLEEEDEDLDSVVVAPSAAAAVPMVSPKRPTKPLKRVAEPPLVPPVDPPSADGRTAVSVFPVEADAAEVPMLDSLRAAIAATTALEREAGLAPHATPATDLDPRNSGPMASVRVPLAPSPGPLATALGPPAGAVSSPGATDLDERPPRTTSTPGAAGTGPLVPSPGPLATALGPPPGAAPDAGASATNVRVPSGSSSAALAVPDASAGDLALAGPATGSRSAPTAAPTGSRSAATAAPTGSRSTVAPPPALAAPLPSPGPTVELSSWSSPSLGEASTPSGLVAASSAVRLPAPPRVLNATVAAIALLCLGGALGLYLTLGGESEPPGVAANEPLLTAAPPDAAAAALEPDAAPLAVALEPDAATPTASPAEERDASPTPTADPPPKAPKLRQAPSLAQCRELDAAATVDDRRSCVERLCRRDLEAARRIWSTLEGRARASLLQRCPGLAPPKPEEAPPTVKPDAGTCTGPLCRRS
ncbi:MAG: protein kinase [Kofleriaceae bacterium]